MKGPMTPLNLDQVGMRGVSETLFEITLEMPVVTLPNRLIMKDTEPRQWQITWMRRFGPLCRRTASKAGGKSNSAMSSMLKRLRSEEHTSELQSRFDLVCRLLLEKKKN